MAGSLGPSLSFERFRTASMAYPVLFGIAMYTPTCSGSEAGSYLRLIDSCITQIEAQGPSSSSSSLLSLQVLEGP